MTSTTARADPDPARNLQVLLGIAALLYVAWSWADFSGPFRLFVDVQLRWLGSYSEWAAGIASVVVMAAVVALAVMLLARAVPDLSKAAADAAVATVFAAASVVALWQIGHLWHEATHLPRLSDPLQVVDLGNLGHGAPPVGHVRVIGTPDRSRQVLVYVTGRRARNSYWEAWVPLAARQQHDPDAPVRIVATARASDRTAAGVAVPDDPQGLLLFDSVDTRTIYEARQEGLDLPEPAFALYADEGVRFDTLVSAALLGSFLALCWGFAAYGWIKERRAGNAPTVAVPAGRPDMAEAPKIAAADTSAKLPPATTEPADSTLTRLGMGLAVGAVLVGGLLWEMFGFFPPGGVLLDYGAAIVTLAVAMLLMWAGQRSEASTQGVPPVPTPHAPGFAFPDSRAYALAHALTPPPGAALLCVLRDEPGFSSTSYKRVDVDGVRVADLKANRYTVVALWPGRHTLAVNTRVSLTSDTVVRFDVAAGDVLAYRMEIPFFGSMRLERMADIAAVRATLARLRPVDGA